MIPTKNIIKSIFNIRHNSNESLDANFDQVGKSFNQLCENSSHLSDKAAHYLGISMQSNDHDNVRELNENSCEFQEVIEGNDDNDGQFVCNATDVPEGEVQSTIDAADFRDNDHFHNIGGNTHNKHAGYLEHSDSQINDTYDRFDGNISNTSDVFGNTNVTANQSGDVGDATRLDENIKSCTLFTSLEFQHKLPLNKSLKQELPTEVDLNPYSVKADDCEISLNEIAKEAEVNLEEYFYKPVGDNEDCNDRSVLEEVAITEASSLFSESERSPDCICKCHCRRTFLQNGKSKSRRITGQKRNDNLQYNTELSSSRGVIKPNESNLTKSAFRTRLKSFNLSETSAVSHTKGFRLWCNNVHCVQLKAKMAKIIFYCVILFLLCLFGGVLMMHKSSEESEVDNSDTADVTVPLKQFKQQDKHIDKPVTDSSLILDLPFRAVPKDEFENHLSRSKSAAEMLKIFFSDQNLTEEQVNSIMFMKSHETVYASKDNKANPMLNDEEDERSYRELAYQQYVEFERSPMADCSEPRPEIETIVDTYSDSIRHYLPSCTVVHRCRNTTACCPRGSVCAPKRVNGIELFERFFMVLEAVPGENTLRPSKDFIAAKTFLNHTACECQQIEVDTNCHKECPTQFTKQRPGVDCECVCSQGHRKCQKINKGLLHLDEKDLECIKEERCIIPTCLEGEFNIFTGFCPHFRRSRRDKGKK